MRFKGKNKKNCLIKLKSLFTKEKLGLKKKIVVGKLCIRIVCVCMYYATYVRIIIVYLVNHINVEKVKHCSTLCK